MPGCECFVPALVHENRAGERHFLTAANRHVDFHANLLLNELHHGRDQTRGLPQNITYDPEKPECFLNAGRVFWTKRQNYVRLGCAFEHPLTFLVEAPLDRVVFLEHGHERRHRWIRIRQSRLRSLSDAWSRSSMRTFVQL